MQPLRLLILFLFFQQYVFAQQFSCINITTEQGLPSSEVYDILQDKRGYIWFATNHGIAWYNGKEFKSYTTSDGLPDNTVFRMCEDSKGRIWFASQSNELCYWENDSIYHSPTFKALPTIISTAHLISGIYIDSSDNIWINSSRDIFFATAKKNYTDLKQLPVNADCTYELRIAEGKFPLFGYNSLYNMEKFLTKDYVDIVFNCHQKNQPDHNIPYTITNKLVRLPFLRGAYGYSPKNDSYFFSFNNLLLAINKDQVKAYKLDHEIIRIATDQYDNTWIGLHKGGVVYYPGGDFSRPPITMLNGVSVDDIVIDKEGGVWIATLEKGVFYIPSLDIVNYQNIPYLNDHIIFIGELDKKIIVSAYGDKICEKKDSGFVLIDHLCKQAEKRLSMFYLAKIRDTVYASFSGELIRYAPQFIPHKNRHFQSEFGGGKIVLATTDNHIWLVYGGGLKKINNQKATSIIYPTPFRVICALAEGKNILIGGKKGLYLFKDDVYTSLSNIDTLLKSPIIEMCRDKKDVLWMATMGKGVLRLKNNKVTQITEKKGLISNVCTSISTDAYGNIWIGTNKGISCIQNPEEENEKWIIKNINDRNGLNSNDVTKLFAFENSLWVGTMLGLNCINIKNMLRPIPSSDIYIHSIQVNNQRIDKAETVFPYNKNNLRFQFHALTFKDRGDHVFRYRLIGLDTVWQYIKTDELLMNNLAPGKYSLQVQVANKDTIWSKSATYSFTITKPFWLRWWFITSELLLLLLLIYLLIRWRIRVTQKKEQEKLRINKLLSEYQMKALTAQMNPHFIFNAINSIQNFIIQNHSRLAYDYLIKFSKLIRMVLNNSKENEITIQAELDTLALYVELEQLRFQNSFDFSLTADPELDLESLIIPSLLLQPYIENAIWHGLMPLKERKGFISITIIKKEDNLLKITITDNGVGRKASDEIKKKIVNEKHQSVGMELTGKRIELFGLESKFSLQIIDNYDDNQKASGTTIEIILPMVEMY